MHVSSSCHRSGKVLLIVLSHVFELDIHQASECLRWPYVDPRLWILSYVSSWRRRAFICLWQACVNPVEGLEVAAWLQPTSISKQLAPTFNSTDRSL
jgi:hypothetical protein